MARGLNTLCKRAHYHVRGGNGKLRWQRYYSLPWARLVASAYGGTFVGTYSRADYCECCLEIKRERKRVG